MARPRLRAPQRFRQALSTAEAAWSNMDTREQLVNELKDRGKRILPRVPEILELGEVGFRALELFFSFFLIIFSMFPFHLFGGIFFPLAPGVLHLR